MTTALVLKNVKLEDANVKQLEFYATPNAIMVIFVKINRLFNKNEYN
jgi:hypothetical protein